MDTRIGFGFDSHVFKAGVPLRIGGLTLDHPEGLAGHSDGDVLLHAITDALLGSIAAGDIGTFFPPGDPRWKDADSAIFLNLALEELQHAGYRIVNVDTSLILAAPKISPVAPEMRSRVADLLDVDIEEFEGGVRKALAELGSSHTVFYHERTNRLLPQHSINATLRAFAHDGQQHWHFLDIFEGGPADVAGIKRGDMLVAVAFMDKCTRRKQKFSHYIVDSSLISTTCTRSG